MVWLGARTTASPFAVQQLADAMRGYDKPVMVKNPINPDIHLWTGAIERLHNAGIQVKAAIHRGFSVNGETYYRYPPLWQIAKKLKTIYPQILMIGDPSHMAGRSQLVPTIVQQFVNRHYDGVMIECHPDPTSARTDAQQQLNFAQMETLLTCLLSREEPKDKDELSLLRERIDDIDDRLLTLLHERLETVEQLGAYKTLHKLSFSQPERFRHMLKQRLVWCKAHGMDEEFVSQLFQLIQKESIQRQQKTNNDQPLSTAEEV